ncbi:MAG: ester cyclase [Chloroflexia bacterium]|nr:ester cyclase [Chloroflexia bacterium]
MRRFTVPFLVVAVLVLSVVTGSMRSPVIAQDATPTSDLEANKALASRFHEELFNQGNMDAADEILAPDFVWHYPPNESFAEGPEGAEQQAVGLREFFPDLVLTEDDMIAEGDRVVIRWTLRATAQVEVGGAPVTVTGIDIFRVADGQLAELWQLYDEQGLNLQLEEIPATPAGTPTS